MGTAGAVAVAVSVAAAPTSCCGKPVRLLLSECLARPLRNAQVGVLRRAGGVWARPTTLRGGAASTGAR